MLIFIKMEPIKVYISSLEGDNEKGVINDSTKPFKDLDILYTRLRGQETTKTTHINFYVEKGFQRLNLERYFNCHFNGIDTIIIGTVTTLENVNIEGKITVELPTIIKSEMFIVTEGNVEVAQYSILKIVEGVRNKKVSYPEIIVILNKGNLKIDTKPTIEVNRKITFVKNENSVNVKFPNVQSQGGILFTDTLDSKGTLVSGDGSTSDVKVSTGKSVGYLVTSNIPNKFSIGKFDNDAVFQNCKIDVKIPLYPELYSNPLFIISDNNIKSTKTLLTSFNFNTDEHLLLQNSEVNSEVSLPLCNNNLVTKVNTNLYGIFFNKERPYIKKITGNYVLDDTFSDRYHIESVDNITITIPDEVDIGNHEIYFHKVNINSKMCIKTKKLHSSTGTLILDQGKTQVILYKHEGYYYTKNLY